METLTCQRTRLSLRTNPKRRRGAAFTLVELAIGVTIMGLVGGSVLFALNLLNYYATANRLYTCAQTLAQNQVDLILTKGPFDPSQSLFPTPNVLNVGTYYSDPSTPNTLYGSSRNVTLYKDPASGNAIVKGTIATTVQTVGLSISGVNLNLRKATVKVSYTFRRRNYTVSMDTMRSPDA